MSDYDNGFARAQRDYDRQLPPGSDEVECPACDGEKTIPCSNCCESEIRNGHCMECGKTCGYASCSTCDGTGLVKDNHETLDLDAINQQIEDEGLA